MARRKMKWGKIALIGGAAAGGLWVANKYIFGPGDVTPRPETVAAIKSQVAAKEEPANIVKTLLGDEKVKAAVEKYGGKATSAVTDLLSKLGLKLPGAA